MGGKEEEEEEEEEVVVLVWWSPAQLGFNFGIGGIPIPFPLGKKFSPRFNLRFLFSRLFFSTRVPKKKSVFTRNRVGVYAKEKGGKEG